MPSRPSWRMELRSKPNSSSRNFRLGKGRQSFDSLGARHDSNIRSSGGHVERGAGWGGGDGDGIEISTGKRATF